MNRAIAYVIVSILIVSIACNPEPENRFANIETDNKSQQLISSIPRMEIDLFGYEPEAVSKNIKAISEKYKGFFDVFMLNIVKAGNPQDSLFIFNLLRYLNDPTLKEVYQAVVKEFPDSLNQIANELNDCFARFKYFFPQKAIPSVYTCISGFNFPIIVTDSALAISLDMYLSNKYPYFDLLQLPRYKSRKMQREYIVADAVKAWIYSEFEYNLNRNDLISQMIYHGRLHYVLDALMPQTPDTLKLGFTQAQLNWCKRNEANMYAYLIEKKLLYTTNNDDIAKLLNEGPFTSLFSKESPAQTGIWIGREIVKKYMSKNDKLTLSELLNEKDAHKIFVSSGYKPKK